MARTSRKRNTGIPAGAESPQGKNAVRTTAEKVYRTALYVRLSVMDSGRKDSDAVETQEALLRHFIKGKPCFSLFSVYVDNGESGVDFQRDEFGRLMEDVRSGQVDCIIVKDLSRFGRNYIEAGEYLEKVFPFLGVRFIAVNDNVDTADPASADGLSLHLKNLVNDIYARDISAKTSPALRGKQMRGEFIGDWASYGYAKSPEDKHRFVIDENVASVVRNIFAWRLEGTSYQGIARRLTEHGIPSPSQYRYNLGIMKNEKYASIPWRIATVKRILASEVYLGHMVQGRKRKSLFAGQGMKHLPREEWTVVRDTHEPLIDRDTFDRVQELNSRKKREYEEKQGRFSGVENTENILKGLVYCGVCGTKLVRYKNIRENKRKEPRIFVWYNYICPAHAADPTLCGFGSIRESELLDAVWEAVKVQMELAGDMEKRMSVFQWEDPARQERENLEAPAANPWLKSMLQFRGQAKLTREMAVALVEKVTIYSDRTLRIEFRFSDEFRRLEETLSGKPEGTA